MASPTHFTGYSNPAKPLLPEKFATSYSPSLLLKSSHNVSWLISAQIYGPPITTYIKYSYYLSPKIFKIMSYRFSFLRNY